MANPRRGPFVLLPCYYSVLSHVDELAWAILQIRPGCFIYMESANKDGT